MPRAIVASLDYWTSPVKLGGHHIARSLSVRGWQVAYISWPISPAHLLSGRLRIQRERLRIYRMGGLDVASSSIWAYVPGTLLSPFHAPLLRSRWVHRNWIQLTVPNLGKKLAGRGFGKVDLLFFDVPIHVRMLEIVDAKQSVMRIPDRLGGFGHLAPAMLDVEREAASKVDLVTYAAASLESHVRELGPKRMLHLPNGVEFEKFATSREEVPEEMRRIRRPIAIYVGAMREWFDFEAINQLGVARPDLAIVLIGDAALARRFVTPRANVHLLGAVAHERVPGYLQHADVALIPFDATGHPELVHGVHPLKLYEYLAAGLPVVARRWRELEALQSPAQLYDTHEEFVAAVTMLLERRPEPTAGVEFARNADWSMRVDDLLRALARLPS